MFNLEEYVFLFLSYSVPLESKEHVTFPIPLPSLLLHNPKPQSRVFNPLFQQLCTQRVAIGEIRNATFRVVVMTGEKDVLHVTQFSWEACKPNRLLIKVKSKAML